ncbi:MAG TPA: PAS domain S-box protein, partial [Methanomicrobiales archaeon]|nr:PAS domain S-box protein [Methanomicrobiales archaeon]
MSEDREQITQELQAEIEALQQENRNLHQIEEALRESEKRYRTLVETALDAILIHDSEKILYINPAGLRLLGASHPDEIVGKSPIDIIHPAFRERIRENIALDLRGERSPLTELQLLRLDGTSVWAEGQGVQTCIDGKLTVQVIIRDLSGRKRAEETLQENLNHLKLLSSSATRFLESRTGDEIFQFTANQLQVLAGRAVVIVSEYDPRNNCTTVRAVAGPEDKLEIVPELLLRDLYGLTFTVAEGTISRVAPGTLAHVEGGLYDLCFGQLPESLCRQIEKKLDLGEIYAM